MKKLRKILGLFVAAVITMGLAVPANASVSGSTDDSLQRRAAGLIGAAISDPNTTFESGAYTIGDKIPAYYLDSGAVGDFSQAEYYPVFCDGTPAGMFIVHGANTSEPTYSIGKEFIAKPDKTVLSSGEDYKLVVTDRQIFAATADTAHELAFYRCVYQFCRLC